MDRHKATGRILSAAGEGSTSSRQRVHVPSTRMISSRGAGVGAGSPSVILLPLLSRTTAVPAVKIRKSATVAAQRKARELGGACPPILSWLSKHGVADLSRERCLGACPAGR
jgi:hypothetical protein